jgi:hypothetical protein
VIGHPIALIWSHFFVVGHTISIFSNSGQVGWCMASPHNFETRHPSDDSDQVWFPLV